MKETIVIINSLTFGILACIHFYWAFGGKIWLNYALPTNPSPEVKFSFKPGFFSTIIVGIGLAIFGIVIFSNLPSGFSSSYTKLLTRIIGVIFLIRTIGDFKYVGISKKIRNTVFAKKDSQIFVPLCFWLSISSILISFLP